MAYTADMYIKALSPWRKNEQGQRWQVAEPNQTHEVIGRFQIKCYPTTFHEHIYRVANRFVH